MPPSTAVSSPRWVDVGSSDQDDARLAGRSAAADALTGYDAKLVVVFHSAGYDAAALLEGIREVTGEVPLIGCSTAGEIAGGRTSASSVVVTVFGGAGFAVATECAQLGANPRAAGATVAGCATRNVRRQHRILLLLFDGMASNQEDILRGAYGVVGADVPLVGGASGDSARLGATSQLHGGSVLEGAVVGALIDSDAPFGIGVQHGWTPHGDPMIVTRAADGRIYSLDDKPALDVYLDRFEAPPDAYSEPGAFNRHAMTRPLSVRRHSGVEVRAVSLRPDFADRSLRCGGEMPEGSLTWVMEGDVDSVLRATDGACIEAVAGLGGLAPIAFLAFDCAARLHVLGDSGVAEEMARLSARCGDSPLAGFYTFAEVARLRGVNGFHHQTLVMLAIA